MGNKRISFKQKCKKKRKKGQTLKEWFLYSRYRNEIPKTFLMLYFLIVFIHPLALISCIIFRFIEELTKFGQLVLIGITLFDGIWFVILKILFWSPGPNIPYERWISKKGGNKRKGK